MSDELTQYEKRTPPNDAEAIQAAKAQPGARLYDIDWPYPNHQRTPPEAIRGCWQIDSHRVLSDSYAANKRYRAIVHSARPLKPYMHAAAKTNPDQWMVEVDPRGEALFPNIPEHLIRGWWYIDSDGKITDQFRPNSRWVDDTPQRALFNGKPNSA